MAEITFTDVIGVTNEFAPTPASACIPNWYKELPSYLHGIKKPLGDGTSSSTIKRCMPVFDALNGGYIIYSYTDVFISQKDLKNEEGKSTGKTYPWYEWASYEPIAFHNQEQLKTYPNLGTIPEGIQVPKWINPWSIKTPKGYSIRITQPAHRSLPFTILEAVVDTDHYTPNVNFPFVLNDWTFEGLIPAGTPIAQITPFKRESWKMRLGNKDDFQEQKEAALRRGARFFDGYKDLFRQPKEYK